MRGIAAGMETIEQPMLWDLARLYAGQVEYEVTKLSLLVEYYQFYVQDEAVTGDLSNSWNEEATARLLAVAPGTVGIGAVGNMVVPVALEIHDQEPGDDISAWDHAVKPLSTWHRCRRMH